MDCTLNRSKLTILHIFGLHLIVWKCYRPTFLKMPTIFSTFPVWRKFIISMVEAQIEVTFNWQQVVYLIWRKFAVTMMFHSWRENGLQMIAINYSISEEDLSEDSTEFMDMNDDCLLKVFEYLPLNDVCSLSETCKRMHELGSTHFMQKYKSKQIVFVRWEPPFCG